MFPGHKICQLRNNNHRLRSGVSGGECDNTLERILHFRGEEARSKCVQLAICLSFVPCLHEEADTRTFVRATEAAKMPNKKINSCAVDTDEGVLAIPVVQQL